MRQSALTALRGLKFKTGQAPNFRVDAGATDSNIMRRRRVFERGGIHKGDAQWRIIKYSTKLK
jgi:hypothetical protein